MTTIVSRTRMRPQSPPIRQSHSASLFTSARTLLVERALCPAQTRTRTRNHLQDAGHPTFATASRTTLLYHQGNTSRAIMSPTDPLPSGCRATDLTQGHRARHPLLLYTVRRTLLPTAPRKPPSLPRTSHRCKRETTTTGPPCPQEQASDQYPHQTPDMPATLHP